MTHDTSDAMCDFAYCPITDVRDNDAAHGKHEKNDDSALDRPRAMNSWFGLTSYENFLA